MKRHPSLAHLSREHHGALILARLLQKNAPAYKDLPVDTEGKATYALKFYKEELVRHFEEEESVLKMVIGINGALDLLVQKIFVNTRNCMQCLIPSAIIRICNLILMNSEKPWKFMCEKKSGNFSL
jgi:hypothetical protein